MRTALQRIRPDIVHYPANFARWAGRGGVASTKVVLTVHDLSFMRSPEWFRWERATYYRVAIRPSVRLADVVIADSQATADDLTRFLAVPAERIAVVLLGVDDALRPADAAAIKRVRMKYGLPERFYLYLGTIEPRKNLPRVIEAFDAIAAKTDAGLVIAGREGWKAETTRRAYSEAAHRDHVTFPGFVAAEDMAALMSAAMAFVWPSLWEGFGLPPLEAMACGTPVVTSKTSSLPEVVGDAALLVNPESVDEIAEAMRRIGEDEALRTKLRAAGLARARELTWRRTAEQTAAVYRRVAGR
jgi:glycosyltransferase involved in cell wall biosynthesis